MNSKKQLSMLTVYLFTLTLGILFLFVFGNETQAKPLGNGWLGIGIEELTPSIKKEFGLKTQNGILITRIFDKSPADKAGLQENDIILSYNGKSLEYADDFIELVRDTEPESSIDIEIFRDGTTISKKVIITEKEEHCYKHQKSHVVCNNKPYIGVNIQDIDKDLAIYFHVDEHKGVVITEVFENSPADKAGLKSGDVITKIDNEAIHYCDDIQYTINHFNKGDKVELEIVRKGKVQKIEVILDSKDLSEMKLHKHGFPCNVNIDRFGDVDIHFDELEIDLDNILDDMQKNLSKLFDDFGI